MAIPQKNKFIRWASNPTSGYVIKGNKVSKWKRQLHSHYAALYTMNNMESILRVYQYINGCVSYFSSCCNQNNWELKGKDYLFWLTMSEMSVHCVRKGVAYKNSSHQGRQEIEKERERERWKGLRQGSKVPAISDLLPPARSQFLKVCRTSQNSATSWGLSIQLKSLYRTFHILTSVMDKENVL
jgi:hypothetical protein